MLCAGGCAVLTQQSKSYAYAYFDLEFSAPKDLSASTITIRAHGPSGAQVNIVHKVVHDGGAQNTDFTFKEGQSWVDLVVKPGSGSDLSEITGLAIGVAPPDVANLPPTTSVYIEFIRCSNGAFPPFEFGVDATPFQLDPEWKPGTVSWAGP